MVHWTIALDFINVVTSFAGGFYLNTPYFYQYSSLKWVIFVMVIVMVLINFHCSHILIKTKTYIIQQIRRQLTVARGRFQVTDESMDKLQKRLEEHLQISDVAQYAFGPFGKFLIEISMHFAQFAIIVFQITLVGKKIQLSYVDCTQMNLTYRNESTCDVDVPVGSPFYKCSIDNGSLIFYMLIPFTVFCLLSLIRTPRHASPINLISFLSLMTAVLVIIVEVYRKAHWYTAYDIHVNYRFYLYATLSIPWLQLVVQSVPIEGSMIHTRQYFPSFLIISGVFTMITCLAFASGVYTNNWDLLDVFCFLSRVERVKVINILQIIGILGLYPIQNFPLIQAFERRFLSPRFCRTTDHTVTEEEMVEPLLPAERSVSDLIRKLRLMNEQSSQSFREDNEQFRPENFLFREEDIGKSLEVQASWCSRYVLRFCIVVLQLTCAAILMVNETLVKVLIGLCVFSSRLVAFIFPCAIQSHCSWYELSIFSKIKNILIMFASVAEILYSLYRIIVFDFDVLHRKLPFSDIV